MTFKRSILEYRNEKMESMGDVIWDEESGVRFRGMEPQMESFLRRGVSPTGLVGDVLLPRDGRAYFDALPFAYGCSSRVRVTEPKDVEQA